MLNNLGVVIKTVKSSSKSKAGNIGKSHPGQYIPKIIEDLNIKGTPMDGAVLKLDLSDGQWYYATDSALTCVDVQDCIEAFTNLDLSTVVVTLGEICGDITFCAGGSTIDRTNTIQTGTTSFDENYVATYNDNSTINFNGDVYRGATSTQTYISGSIITGETNYNSFTATYDDASTLNFEGSTINIYDGATFNITDSFFNSTNNTRVFDGDTITYSSTTEVTYNGTTINYNATIQNYDGDTINRNNVTQNVTNSNITYDDNSTVTFEGDVYVGGNIINITNNFNTGGLATEEGGFGLWNDINNVLTCDGNNATQDVTDPTNMDYVQLVVGGVRAGAPLTNASTTGAPGYYGSASEMRSLPLTPAIINSSDFGASFRYGDSTYVLVTDFGFSIPLTDTITGVKVSVIYDYSAPTISVDCITITVYSTDGSPLQSGVNIYEAGVLVVANATDLNFNTGATVTDMGGGTARVDITGGGGGIGLVNIDSANDSLVFAGDPTWTLTGDLPLSADLVHLTTDSGTNLILGIDYTIDITTGILTWILTPSVGETVYARWVIGNRTPGTVPGGQAYYEEYVATGGETDIVLSNTPSGANWIRVSTESSLYGKQGATRDRTYDAGTNTITMNYALQAGDVVSVQYIGFVAAPGDSNITEEFTGDGINDTFTLAQIYTGGAKVYLNGLRLKSTNYTVSGTSLQFAVIPALNDEVLIDYKY